MDDLEEFIEISLPDKEDFYSQLNMEDIMLQITRTLKELVNILK